MLYFISKYIYLYNDACTKLINAHYEAISSLKKAIK